MLGDIYRSGEYERRNPQYHVADSPWKAGQILRMLDRHRLRPASVVEVGCGAGEVLRQLQLRLPATTTFDGYDVSPGAIALCRERENERLRFHCAGLPSESAAPFDLLLCLDVLEHVEDCASFLRSLRLRATHKIFHVPLDMSVQGVLRVTPILRSRAVLGHLHYFMKDTALATLRDAGYELIDHRYTPAALARGRSLATRIANVPRRVVALASADLAARALGGYSLLVLAR
jgi:SAM-dependent methyltransferase